MPRQVDNAMDAERPPKKTMRTIWAETVGVYARRLGECQEPLYLTLAGAQGKDIEMLIERGVIQRMESGAIRAEDATKVVAVETNPDAVLELQRRFPGLKILELPIQNLLRGEGPFRWPEGTHEEYCRARVVNLDLNAVLRAIDDDGEIVFPVIAWIAKFGQLHAQTPRLDWTLCLTLHGEIHWSAVVCQAVEGFLSENFEREPQFGASCREFLGDALYERIRTRDGVDFSRLNRESGIRVLMAFVPKKIIHVAHTQGWRITTNRNLRYGGTTDQAPMVTWELGFARDSSAGTTPDRLYRECISQILERHGRIEDDGSLS